ncbi:MAG: DNA polymerase III subunit gamma/tau [Patescibacteria group bacterium]|nr:DNA polymerase III subunit gamma/tau [Patescibacteria group bacterium]
MLALYRKYRPSKFQEVIGQDHIIQTLINSLKMGKMQHAYLFCGPKGTGKTTMARIIAKAVNCLNLDNLKKSGEPCLTCENCQAIQNNSMDIIEVDAASNRGIDEIRELRDASRFTPSKLKFKVFIIDEVHMLTKEAFNALLKTLEEPPAHILFILATTEHFKVPDTIKSRCQRFDLKKISIDNLISHLKTIAQKENIKIDDNSLKLISANASGSSRDALSLLSSLSAFSDSDLTYEKVKEILGITDQIILTKFIDYIINKDTANAVKQVNELAENGINLNQFSLDLIDYLRKLMLLKVSPELSELAGFSISSEQTKKMQNQATKIDQNLLLKFIDSVIKRSKEMNDTPFIQLSLELAIIENLPAQNVQLQQQKFLKEEKPETILPKQISNASPQAKVVKPIAVENTEITKPIVQENIPNQDSATNNLDISKIQGQWQAIITEIKKANYSLGGILGTLKLISLESNCLTLACPYPFHQEIVHEIKNKILLEEAISKIVKANISTKLILTKDLPKEVQENINKETEQKEKQKTADLYNAAVSAFGKNI